MATTSAEIVLISAPQRSIRMRAWVKWTLHHKVAVACLVFIILVSFIAIFPAVLSPFAPNELGVGGSLKGPSAANWFGTDKLGRDQLSRIMYGARPSLGISASSTGMVLIIGVIVGLVAGYWSGWVDRIIMRISDAIMAFPAIILALAFVTALGPGVMTIVVVLTFVSWPRFARLARASTLSAREEDYVLSARATGASHLRIALRHILPNIASPLIVQAALMLSVALLAEAGLSFLGLGLAPPAPDWGRMVSEGQPLLRAAPWLSVAPGLAIFLVVLALNLLGDTLRDMLDPRLRGR